MLQVYVNKMAAGRGKLLLTVFILLNLFIGGENAPNKSKSFNRRTRAVVAFIAQYAAGKFLDKGLELLLAELSSEPELSDQLKEMYDSLQNIEAQTAESLKLLKEVKHFLKYKDAEAVEVELLGFFSTLKTLTSTKIRLNNETTGEKTTKQFDNLKTDVKKYREEVKITIPKLLIKLSNLIIGKTIIGAGRTLGVVCDYVESVIDKLRSDGATYSVNMTVQRIHNYRDSLMELQVRSFQLLNATSCSEEPVKCTVLADELEQRLQAQFNRLVECIPRHFAHLAKYEDLDNIHIIDPDSKKGLYNTQMNSIIKKDPFERMTAPEEMGLSCVPKNTTGVWSLVKSSKYGYHLREANGCFLSFDDPLKLFQAIIPIGFESLDRNEFMICLEGNQTAATFLLFAEKNDLNTFYELKEVSTGKYLHYHRDETDIAIQYRKIVFHLFLKNSKHQWQLREVTNVTLCDSNAAAQGGSISAVHIVFVVLSSLTCGLMGVWIYSCWKHKTLFPCGKSTDDKNRKTNTENDGPESSGLMTSKRSNSDTSMNTVPHQV